MSVYIKGMNMPEFFDRLFVGRSFNGGIYIRNEREDGKSDSVTWYPVIEIPPHGKLIDADGKTFPTPHRNPSNDYMKGWNACLRSVQQQPTVIPAEKEKP